jgi:hypothetical protein
MSMASKIQKFLSTSKFAVVGASTNRSKFGNKVRATDGGWGIANGLSETQTNSPLCLLLLLRRSSAATSSTRRPWWE